MYIQISIEIPSNEKPVVALARVRAALEKEFGADVNITVEPDEDTVEAEKEIARDKIETEEDAAKKYSEEEAGVAKMLSTISDEDVELYMPSLTKTSADRERIKYQLAYEKFSKKGA